MLSIIDKNRRQTRFCLLEQERMQAQQGDTLVEKFIAFKPATTTLRDPSDSTVIWADYDNLGNFKF